MNAATAEQFERIEGKLDKLLARAAAPPVRWLTVEGAAHYSSMSADSIRRMLSSGTLQPHRPRKGRILIDSRQLDSVIQGSTARPRAGRGFHLHTV